MRGQRIVEIRQRAGALRFGEQFTDLTQDAPLKGLREELQVFGSEALHGYQEILRGVPRIVRHTGNISLVESLAKFHDGLVGRFQVR